MRYILQRQTLSETAFVMKKLEGQKLWNWLPGITRFLEQKTLARCHFSEENFCGRGFLKSSQKLRIMKLPTNISVVKIFLYHRLNCDNNNIKRNNEIDNNNNNSNNNDNNNNNNNNNNDIYSHYDDIYSCKI